MRIIFTLSIVLMGFAFSAQAQQRNFEHPDLEPTTNYDPIDVWNEWKAWYANPNESNAYVQKFMDEYDVPAKGIKNLTREETWYWWISNHSEEIQDYFQLKRDAQ